MAELSFGVKIWGEISQFLKALNQGKDGMKDFEKGAVSSFKGLSDNVKAAEMKFKNLAATMGINSPEAKKALAGLKEIKEKYVEINQAASSAGKSNSLTSQLSESFGGLGSKMLTLGGAVGVAKLAFDEFQNILSLTDDGALELEARTGLPIFFLAPFR